MKRYILIVVVLLLFILAINLNAEKYPRNTLVELIANSSHGCATQAANGLAVVRDNYHVGELSIVRYYSYPEGSYGNEETQARINWMEPEDNVACYFNGGDNEDGGEGAGTGTRYLPHCEEKNIEFSPIMISVTPIVVDGSSGSFSSTIEVGETFNAFGMVITAVIVQDGLSSVITNVTRTLLDNVNLTAATEGATQTENFTFDIEEGWNASNLHAVVFVQDIASKEVIQSGNDYEAPAQYHRVCAEELSAMGTINEDYQFEDLLLYTYGDTSDDYLVTLETDFPDGWWSMFCDESSCYPSQATFPLDGGTIKHLHVSIHPTTDATGSATLTVSSDVTGISKSLEYILNPPQAVNTENTMTNKQVQYLDNYPNPFNPKTIIEYSIPNGASNVNLEIYNVKGMLIKSWQLDSSLAKGSLVWDGKNNSGLQVASGFYFYNLRANGSLIESRKMALIK